MFLENTTITAAMEKALDTDAQVRAVDLDLDPWDEDVRDITDPHCVRVECTAWTSDGSRALTMEEIEKFLDQLNRI